MKLTIITITKNNIAVDPKTPFTTFKNLEKPVNFILSPPISLQC